MGPLNEGAAAITLPKIYYRVGPPVNGEIEFQEHFVPEAAHDPVGNVLHGIVFMDVAELLTRRMLRDKKKTRIS